MKSLAMVAAKWILGLASDETRANYAFKLLSTCIERSTPLEAQHLRRRILRRFFKGRPLIHSGDAVRIYGFFHRLEQLRNVPGDIVECGVGRGRTLQILASANVYLGLNRLVYGFDSFQGFPAASEEDVGTRVQQVGVIHGWEDCTADAVRDWLQDESLSEERRLLERDPEVKLIKGFFAESLAQTLPPRICFLHADADLYESTHAILSYCLPRMSPGGLIVFDELHEKERWPGVQKAVDELCLPRGLAASWFDDLGRMGIQIP